MFNFYLFLIYFLVFLFGAAIGSFICASIYRIRYKKSIIFGRSACPKCDAVLGFFDLIPIFSFIFFKRKCKKCKQKIAWEYFLIEIITGLLFVFALFFRASEFLNKDFFGVLILRDWIFLGSLIFLFVYDLKYKQLPDRVSIPAIIIILFFNLYLGYSYINLLFAAAIGGWWFGLQYLISSGKWVGDGDIRMGVLLGISLGFPSIILALFISYIIGAIISLGFVLNKKKKMKSEIAFGTFLSIGGFVAFYYGEQIINWYLRLL